ncbi:MAG TPA: type I glyceraldehyde-3-phosphate dehydrogenase [Candidatus Nanoarchaeia archaeon]|nr:type I glyceraldehyde-3-phosphate dehydrogenase [Candidatus Nanoarchaeia archaeon]
MMINVAINGFGRIGRMVLRAGWHDKNINFIAINDLTNTKTLAHLLKYDSVHGIFQEEVSCTDNALIVGKKKINVYAQKDPQLLPWKQLKVDVVVESTGFFLTKELAETHLKAGAKKVILSADAKGDGVKTLIMGINESSYDAKKDNIISNASCTSNCTAPLVKVLHDHLKIKHAFFTTTHAYTATQKLHDAPDKNLRNARAATQNIIPHSSGAASAVPLTIPDVKGKLDGMALRVPVIDGSITVLNAVVEKKTTVQEVNQLFQTAAKKMKSILQYSTLPLVSSDIIGNPHSCIFDSEYTKVNGNLVQVLGWYDNEWGYSCRMVDMIKYVV